MNHDTLPRERPVIVLSAGRTGSTLLQKLLNTHEGLVIWGEHDGFLNPLMQSWKAVSRSKWIPDTKPRGAWLLEKPRLRWPLADKRRLNAGKWTAWDGSFSKQSFNSSLRQFVDSLFCDNVPQTMRWGFKEIRYRNIEFMDFWSDLYPEAQYIFLLRNPIDTCLSFTAASAKESKEPISEDNYQMITRFIADQRIKPAFSFFSEAVNKFGGVSHTVIFEDLVEDAGKVLGDIECFLELESGFDPGKVSKIIRKDIVSQRKETGPELRQMLSDMAMPLLEKELELFATVQRSHRKS